MELHEKASHHGTGDLVLHTYIDRWGQPHDFKGQGFRHGSIYEQISEKAGLVDLIWIEGADGRVIFQAKRKHTLKDVLYLRDTAFPTETVCHYHGQYQTAPRIDDPAWGKGKGRAGVTVYPPKRAPSTPTTNCEFHSSPTKKLKKSKKIKRAWA